MNTYFLMVEKIVEDHFTDSDRELLAQKLGKKQPAPKEMNEKEKLRARFKESILNKRKKQ